MIIYDCDKEDGRIKRPILLGTKGATQTDIFNCLRFRPSRFQRIEYWQALTLSYKGATTRAPSMMPYSFRVWSHIPCKGKWFA